MSTEELGLLIAALSLLVAVAPFLVKPLLASLRGAKLRVLTALGHTRSRYRRWFLKTHSKLKNIYLNKVETLDLQTTYVPLNVAGTGGLDRTSALSILGDPGRRRILILGDPGSGKTTLLKAFGTGVLDGAGSGHAARDNGGLGSGAARLFAAFGMTTTERSSTEKVPGGVVRDEVPFFVPLRTLASRPDVGVVDFLVHSLGRELGEAEARALVERTLRAGRALLLFDGLDEVSNRTSETAAGAAEANAYENLKTRLARFLQEHGDQARVVLTCRAQNFYRIADDWVPGLFPEHFVLAPFTDDEIYRFLERRKADYQDGRSALDFFRQVQSSQMVHLHRNPLILTISLGLYLNVPGFQIPKSLATFYEEMIQELLRRHDFRLHLAETESLNRFDAGDKYRFLRELALAMAEREDQFEEFSYREMRSLYDEFSEHVANIGPDDAGAFLDEILSRSGLITRISDEDEYIFAHRSIHEYLAAVQLGRHPEAGIEALLARQGDQLWHQVIIFFCSLDLDQVPHFLDRLREVNLLLCARCVPAARKVPRPLAETIVAALGRRAGGAADLQAPVAALVAIAGSHDLEVRDLALDVVRELLQQLGSAESLDELASLGDPALVGLMDALAHAGTPELARRLPALRRMVSDPRRAVPPLWKALHHPEIAEAPPVVRNPLLAELLSLAMDPACFATLQDQPAFAPPDLTDAERRRAYPFRRGVDLRSNLVTLLAMAERAGVEPETPNRYFEAKEEDEARWRTLEEDAERGSLEVELFWPARLVSHVSLLVSLGWLGWTVLRLGLDGTITQIMEGPVSWHEHLADVIGALAGFIIYLLIEGQRVDSTRTSLETRESPPNQLANPIASQINMHTRPPDDFDEVSETEVIFKGLAILLLLAIPCALMALAASLFLEECTTTHEAVGRVLIVAAFGFLTYWLPASELFARGNRLILRKPTPFLDIYDDPRSRHWIHAG